MPASASVNVHQLTDYARGIAQDRKSALAEFMFPSVLVGGAVGKFKSFSDKNAFQVVDTARAIGGPARRLEFEATDPDYNCTPNALEIGIDDHERELAGDGDGALEEAKVETLIQTAVTSHEVRAFGAAAAALTPVASRGVWSNADNDPVKELNEQIAAIATATGQMPNRLVFGLAAWQTFREHPKVIARQPGAQLIGLNYSQAAALLLNPSAEIRVGVLSKDTAKFGAGRNVSNVVGPEVYIFYASPSPTLFDHSFGKTFRTSGGGVDKVSSYRDDRCHSDVLKLHWSVDVQVVSTLCGRRLSIS